MSSFVTNKTGAVENIDLNDYVEKSCGGVKSSQAVLNNGNSSQDDGTPFNDGMGTDFKNYRDDDVSGTNFGSAIQNL